MHLNKVRAQLKDELRKIPSVGGSGADAGQTYVTQRLNRVLTRAEQEAGKRQGRVCVDRACAQSSKGRKIGAVGL